THTHRQPFPTRRSSDLPMAGVAHAAEPSPFLSKRIQIDEKKHQHAEHAELDANRAAGPEEFVLGREGALGGAERVVIQAVAGDRSEEHTSELQSPDHLV